MYSLQILVYCALRNSHITLFKPSALRKPNNTPDLMEVSCSLSGQQRTLVPVAWPHHFEIARKSWTIYYIFSTVRSQNRQYSVDHIIICLNHFRLNPRRKRFTWRGPDVCSQHKLMLFDWRTLTRNLTFTKLCDMKTWVKAESTWLTKPESKV